MQWTETNPENRGNAGSFTESRLGGLTWLTMCLIVAITALLGVAL